MIKLKDIILGGISFRGNVEQKIITKSDKDKPAKRNKYKPKVFISYSWGDKEQADFIKKVIKDIAKVSIDRKKVKAGDNISKYMKSIIRHDMALIILSDNYMRSKACMTEIIEFMKNDDWKDRIICYVESGDIYKKKDDYIEHWKQQKTSSDYIGESELLEKIVTGMETFLNESSDIKYVLWESPERLESIRKGIKKHIKNQ